MKYERWRIRLNGSMRTIHVQITRETASLVYALHVYPDGDVVGAAHGQQHLVVAAPQDIVRRTAMQMNNHYGELEEVE